MENIDNYRVVRIFSGTEAKLYPTAAPSGVAYREYFEIIKQACSQKKNEISVLELGCGTGRYFHYLFNIEKLTGVDISADMLDRARMNLETMPQLKPVTKLIQSSIENFEAEEKFDFIYSIGTLGEYCEFNEAILKKMTGCLKPDGIIFFTIVDAESFVSNEHVWLRKRLMRFILKLLPYKIRTRFDAKYLITADWKKLFLSSKQLIKILNSEKETIRWTLSKAKDNLHIHHICKVWRSRISLFIMKIISPLYEEVVSVLYK